MAERGREAVFLGLDLGTTGAKAGVVDSSGNLLGTSARAYETRVRKPGWAEQDPQAWWQAASRAISAAIAASGVEPGSVRGVGVSGQMHGAVFLDSAGEVVCPCIIWCDQRTAVQCDAIVSKVGNERLAALAGNPAMPGFTAPKILWLKDNDPESFARVDKVMLPKDYINFRLTGNIATEPSDASGTLLFDIRELRWAGQLLDELEVPLSWLPPVLGSSEEVGTVRREAAAETGLAEGTPVAAGGADNACGAIGMGVISEGMTAVSIGSSGTVLAPTASPVVDPELRLHSFCHAVPGTWYVMGVMLSAGMSLKWFADVLGEPEAGEAVREGRDRYELLDETASLAPPGCEGLIFLPYLTGERTPHADPDARSVLYGLDLSKGRPHVIRSVLEGVVYGLNDSMSLIREIGARTDTVVSGGGGSRSALWRQMQADVFEVPVVPAGESEAAMLGAALLGSVAAGERSSVGEAVAAAVRYGETVDPDPANAKAYRRAYREFRALYPALSPVWRSGGE